jgi:hypothetical protein
MVSRAVTSRCTSPSGLLISAALAAVGCGPRVIYDIGRDMHAEIVLLGGDLHTMDPAAPHATALAVNHSMISVIGDDATVRAEIGPHTLVIELHGKTVTPGLVDAHAHLYQLGSELEQVSVRALGSAEETARVAAAAARDRPPTEWLIGGGWDQNRWPGQQFPTRASLDAAISDRAVMLERIDGHAIWVNGIALRAAGVTAATPDPAGGKILRDGHGEPTGVFIDNAMQLVTRAIPIVAPAVRARRIRAAAQLASSLGLTGVHEMGIDDATIDVYRDLDRRGELPLRVDAFLRGEPAKAAELRTRAPDRAEFGRFHLRGVKFFADGALGSRGARLRADYVDDPGNRGLWVTEPAALTAAIDAAVAGGWQVAVHAIGDAAIGAVLDAYAAARHAHPGDHLLRVEHVQVISADDVARMAALHVIASMQPTHATSDMPWAEARVGAERIVGAYAWRTMLDHHITLAFGSDFPVEEPSPLRGIYAAVTRQDGDGLPAGGWYPAQRLTLDEAIAAFTVGAADAIGEPPGHHGVLAVGRPADLTIYDRPLTPDRGLLEARPELTIVDGRVEYRHQAPAEPAR